MGIPKFYKWLSERYPLINQQINEAINTPEFDCLYLDMNGIIHNCTHSEKFDPTKILTREQMALKIFQYIEKLFDIIKPKKLIYMAIDGVAPRAKMTQQRQRRFRAALEAKQLKDERIRKGEHIDEDNVFDSNCISPGTEFMAELSRHLNFFVRKKISEDQSWRDVAVIFSGHDVPGEGEHKIMTYIRQRKMQPDYNNNLRHCLYGLDADLIMLALVSHEPHFALLREEVVFGKTSGSKLSNKKLMVKMESFQLLHISLLREYFNLEFSTLRLPFAYSLERVIDDFVFLCYLIGNDFIPRIPTLEISDGGLDYMVDEYKKILPTLTGYITQLGHSKMSRIIASLSAYELKVLEENAENEQKKSGGRRRAKEITIADSMFDADEDEKLDDYDLDAQINELAAQGNLAFVGESQGTLKKFQSKYYIEKFGPDFLQNNIGKEKLVKSYVEGLLWVYHYYYNGVASWEWFFPYYYAPLAIDLVNLELIEISFELGTPLHPFEQLLGVLPAASRRLLPEPYQKLMIDQASPLHYFYPTDFEIDMNGKKSSWEGIALIPFVDEKILLDCVKKIDLNRLNANERKRNELGDDLLFSYDKNISDPYPSSLSILTGISRTYTAVSRIPFNIKAGCSFVPALCKNLIYPTPGFPSISYLPITAKLESCGVNVFGYPSKKASSVITSNTELATGLRGIHSKSSPDMLPLGEEVFKLAQKLSQELVGKVCYVSWPYLRQAKILFLSTASHIFNAKSITEMGSDEKNGWYKDGQMIREKLRSQLAVMVGPVSIMLHVRLLRGMKYQVDGSSEKDFGNEEDVEDEVVPLQLAVLKNVPVNVRFLETVAPLLSEAFPIGSDALYIGNNAKIYGNHCEIVAINENDRTLSLNIHPIQRKFINVNSGSAALKEKFFFSGHVAKLLGISPLVLSKITSQVIVNPGHMDIGLNLKFQKQNLMLPGYSRRGLLSRNASAQEQGGWEYSQEAIEILKTYLDKFPAVFIMLARDNSLSYTLESFLEATKYSKAETKPHLISEIGGLSAESDSLKPTIVLNSAVPSVSKGGGRGLLLEICDWIKFLPSSRVKLVPASSQLLSSLECHNIEQDIDNMMVVNLEPYLVENVPFSHVYRSTPFVPWSPSPKDLFALNDRVLSLRSDDGIPFGTLGTVTALYHLESDSSSAYSQLASGEDLIEVLWDIVILSGGDLNGRVSEMRGKAQPFTSLLNISKPRYASTTISSQKSLTKSTSNYSNDSNLKKPPATTTSVDEASQKLRSLLKIGEPKLPVDQSNITPAGQWSQPVSIPTTPVAVPSPVAYVPAQMMQKYYVPPPYVQYIQPVVVSDHSGTMPVTYSPFQFANPQSYGYTPPTNYPQLPPPFYHPHYAQNQNNYPSQPYQNNSNYTHQNNNFNNSNLQADNIGHFDQNNFRGRGGYRSRGGGNHN